MTAVLELEAKIAGYAQQLAHFPKDGSARAKKRIFQKLGKLKKQLTAAENGETVEGDDSDNDADTTTANQKVKLCQTSETTAQKRPRDGASVAVTQESAKKAKGPERKNDSNAMEGKTDQLPATVPKAVAKVSTEPVVEISPAAPVKLSKKETKSLLHSLNNELVDCAIKKQLARAKKAFHQFEKRGVLLDVLSYTNLINVFVRCNDMSGAALVLQEMKAYGLVPNTITLTTMLKGFCEIGLMKEASDLFLNQMMGSNEWNIRSLSTFLRGCTRTGAVDLAMTAFHACYPAADDSGARKRTISVSVDEYADESACLEAIVGLLCRANRLHEATTLVIDYVSMHDQQTAASAEADANIVQNGSSHTTRVLQNASLYVILAKACVLLGVFADAKKYMLIATTMIEEADKSNLREHMRRRFEANATNLNASVFATNSLGNSGDGVQSSGAAPVVAPISKSVELFLAHKRNDLRNQMESIEEYISAVQVAVSGKSAASPLLLGEDLAIVEACRVHALSLSQLLYFGFDGASDLNTTASAPSSSESSLPESLVKALELKFGLNQLRPLDFSANRSRMTTQQLTAMQDITSRRVESMKKAAIDRVFATVDSATGKIDLNRLFPDSEPVVVEKKNIQDPTREEKMDAQGKRKPRTFQSKKKLPVIVRANSSGNNGDSNDRMTGTLPKEYRKLLNPDASDSEVEEQEESESEDDRDNDETNKGNDSASENEDKPSDQKRKSAVPIKLEIGSGNGDWIVAQAATERVVTCASTLPNAEKTIRVKGNWIACELRNDRAHHIWTNHMLSSRHLLASTLSSDDNAFGVTKGGNNLAVLAGDASKIVKRHLHEESISAIFINYPQPPERVAGDHKNQGKHLLTHEFFVDLLRILKKKGTITILTDNLAYAQSLAQTIATINKTALHSRKKLPNGEVGKATLLLSVALEESELEKRVIQESVPFDGAAAVAAAAASNNSKKAQKPNQSRSKATESHDFQKSVVIWRGDPNDDAGHVTMVSSYFDRMWSLGQKKRRWFIFVQKKSV